jgi:hypothetical protein
VVVPAATWIALDELRSAADLAGLDATHGFAQIVAVPFTFTLNEPANVNARLALIASGQAAVGAERMSREVAASDEYGEQYEEAWLDRTLAPPRR